MLRKKNKTNKRINKLNGESFEKYTFINEKNEEFFVIREIDFDRGVTHKSLDVFYAVREEFRVFTNANIISRKDEEIKGYKIREVLRKIDPEDTDQYLVLIDERGNQLHLTGCTSGYAGTGPHGTHEVLNNLGFDIDMRFIMAVNTFNLYLPSYYREVLDS